jgi:uncharacterized membrane protein
VLFGEPAWLRLALIGKLQRCLCVAKNLAVPGGNMTDQPFFIPSVLISVLAIPLVLGLIPRNRWYGIRTAQTLSNERMWYRSNRFGGWALLFSGTIYFVIATMFPTPKPAGSGFGLWGLHLCGFLLPLAASVALTVRYVKSLLKQP